MAPPLGPTIVPPASTASTTRLDRHYTCQERPHHSFLPPVRPSSVNMTDDGTVWSIMFIVCTLLYMCVIFIHTVTVCPGCLSIMNHNASMLHA